MLNQTLTDRIKVVIKVFGGDTDQGLADFLGLKSKSTVFRWRNGDSLPDGASCILIAQKCKVSIDWLLTGEGEMMVEKKPPEQPQPRMAAEPRADYDHTTSSTTIHETDEKKLELLKKTQQVLNAAHPSAPEALASNINCFHDAINDHKRLAILDGKIDQMEAAMKEIIKNTRGDPPLSSQGESGSGDGEAGPLDKKAM